MFKFSHGNGKLSNDTMIFNLPAGKTCPGANICLAFAKELSNGKRTLVHGPEMEFRCFAACSEAQYTNVYNSRHENWKNVQFLLKNFNVGTAGKHFSEYLNQNLKKSTKLIRIHESGDFYSEDYFAMWMHVARLNKDLTFYAYSKNLEMILDYCNYDLSLLPSNFHLTASLGGKFDYYIHEGYFPRYAVVVKNDQEALKMGLEVDHDDTHCYKSNKPFALLIHGNQPAGSEWRKAISQRKKEGAFVGYSK